MRMRVQSLALINGLRIWHCHKLRHRSQTWWLGSGAILAVWHRPPAAALIQPLAQELPYATGVARKRGGEGRRERKKKTCQSSRVGQGHHGSMGSTPGLGTSTCHCAKKKKKKDKKIQK